MIRGGRRGTVGIAVVLLVLGLAALAGCSADVGTVIRIGPRGAGTLGIRLAIDPAVQQLLEQQQAGGVDALFKEFLAAVPAGWTAQQGKDPDGTRWVSAGRPFADLAQLEQLAASVPVTPASASEATRQPAAGDGAAAATGSSSGGGRAGSGGLAALGLTGVKIQQQTGLFWIKTVFRGHVEGKTMASRIAGEGMTDLDAAALDRVVHIEERVSLPGYTRHDNAQAREGGTLVWRFAPSASGDLRAESIAPRWAIAGPALGVVVLLLGVGVFALARWRRTRRRARRARERRRQIRFV